MTRAAGLPLAGLLAAAVAGCVAPASSLLPTVPRSEGAATPRDRPTDATSAGQGVHAAERRLLEDAPDGTVAALADLVKPHHGHGAAVVDGTAYVLLGGPEPLLTADTTVEAIDLRGLAP